MGTLYGSDSSGKKVNKGYICYTSINSLVKELEITPLDFTKTIHIINGILEIIDKGKHPKATGFGNKYIDCC
ncbi:hypothetical protein MettiDRAFT_0754 [Methanolobus tindarius DSM 2278]|uniref:Uncharacterized protein n=1 Tax=Methanolobus tindarius DSM 2278 TaxID=1090322 RepID=W9DN22_METTI|nr:hypothetical protein [Methanolobus tindarius]ETA67334.1 hypothetical protein MettiDRAFT_0754 [Methanolobus tindarius DSM 2278]